MGHRLWWNEIRIPIESEEAITYNDICTAAKFDLIIMGDFNRSGINWATMKSDWRGKNVN